MSVGLDQLQISRRGFALLALLKLEADLLAFVERADAGVLHGGDVDEHVLAAVFGLNEAVALLGVEPLDRTHRHENLRITGKTSAVARHRAADRPSVGGMQVRLIKERSKAVRTQRSDDNRLGEHPPLWQEGRGMPLLRRTR